MPSPGIGGFGPRACAPYRARTKGKDERGVGYVKNNAIADRRFENWPAFEAHLEAWTRDIADQRVHGTTGGVPIERFRRVEAAALRSIAGIAGFAAARELVRKVQADCAIEVDGYAYSVPWRLIGETVRVIDAGGQLRISHAGRDVAMHQRCAGRFERRVDPLHFGRSASLRRCHQLAIEGDERSLHRLETERICDYRPAFQPAEGKPSHEAVRTWARGFWKAMALAPAEWSALAADQRLQPVITPLVGFIGLGDDPEFEPAEDIDDRLDEAAADIPRAILLLRKIAELRASRVPATGPTRRGKIGRNHHCPCGSGKKYKRCCGQS
jgi:hypothetical protein